MKKILFIVLATVAMVACVKNSGLDPKQKVDRDNLTEQTAPCVLKSSTAVVTYSETDHSLYCGTTQLTSRIMKTATNYAEFVFTSAPQLDKDVKVNVLITSGMGQSFNFTATFRVLKIANDLIYIWSDTEKFGAALLWKN